MDKISQALKCMNCLKILSSPVLLPCGHSVCKSHIDENEQTCMCINCGVVNSDCKFYEIKAFSDLINSQLGSLDFGPTHKKAKNLCEQLDDLLAQADFVLKDTEFYIHEQMSEFKIKVDLKRDEYKLKLDVETQKIFTELDDLNDECKLKLKSPNGLFDMREFRKSVEVNRNELNSYLKTLNELKVDENKWKAILLQCNYKIKRLKDQMSRLNESSSLLMYDKLKKCNIEFTVKIEIDNLFEGSLTRIDSKIITDVKMKRDLLKLCEISYVPQFSLLYRGSRDGFRGEDFHSKCDNTTKTFTIVKSTSGCIFGGYTEALWNDTGAYHKRDPSAYLFSLVNKSNEPSRMRVASEDHSIVCLNSYGPIFGTSRNAHHDLFIHDECNVKMSHARLGNSYKHFKYQIGSESGNSFLAGSLYFRVAEIEVFQL